MAAGESTIHTAPGADTFEVSIFGPGKGEAVAVHLGGGDWLTVDSCIEQETKVHPVLRYFEGIGVDPSSQVNLSRRNSRTRRPHRGHQFPLCSSNVREVRFRQR